MELKICKNRRHYKILAFVTYYKYKCTWNMNQMQTLLVINIQTNHENGMFYMRKKGL